MFLHTTIDQEVADTSLLEISTLLELDECNLGEKQLATFATVGQGIFLEQTNFGFHQG